MECLLEDILFDAPDMNGSDVVIDENAVINKLKDIKDNEVLILIMVKGVYSISTDAIHQYLPHLYRSSDE